MGKFYQGLALSAVIFLLTGCVTAKKITKPRVDQSIAGNQGYLKGEAPAVERDSGGARTYWKFDIEVPPYSPKEVERVTKPSPDQGIEGGNRGYILGGGRAAEPPQVEPEALYGPPKKSFMEMLKNRLKPKEETGETGEQKLEGAVKEPPPAEEARVEEKKPALPSTYTVKKNEKLWGIAKKLYGKGSKWPKLYEANKDKIPNPDRIQPGTVLVIPPED